MALHLHLSKSKTDRRSQQAVHCLASDLWPGLEQREDLGQPSCLGNAKRRERKAWHRQLEPSWKDVLRSTRPLRGHGKPKQGLGAAIGPSTS